MANKQRAIEILMTGRVDGKLNNALNKMQRGLNKYRLMLTGVQGAEGKLSKQNRILQNSFGGVGGSIVKTALGYAGAYVGVTQLASGIQNCIGESKSQAAENTRMQRLMMNVRGTTLSQVNAMEEYASKLQGVTTLSDDTIQRGQSQLATYQLQAKYIRRLTPALTDLAVGTYGANVSADQMQQSGNLLGKVFTGQVGALRRVGITFDKYQAKVLKSGTTAQKVAMLQKVINQNYGGIARARAGDAEGMPLRVANAWGEVKEQIGARLMPVYLKAINWLGPKLPSIQTGILGIADAVGTWFVKMKPVYDTALAIGKYVVTNWKWLGPIILGITGAFVVWQTAIKVLTVYQWLLNAAMSANPVGLIILGIGLLIGAIVALVVNWKKVVGWFMRFKIVRSFVNGVAIAWHAVVGAVIAVWGWLIKTWQWFAKLLIVRLYVAALITYWQGLSIALQVAWGWIKNLASIVWGSLVAAWNTYNSVIGTAWSWLVKVHQWFMKLAPVKVIIGGISGAWNIWVNGFKASVNWAKQLWGYILKIANKIKNSSVGKMVGGVGSWADKVIAGKRASGGPVSAGSGYLIGERGPELFFPSMSGYIAPNSALAGAGSLVMPNVALPGAGGGINITFAPNLYFSGNPNQAEVQSGLRASYDEFKRHMSRFLREERRRSND